MLAVTAPAVRLAGLEKAVHLVGTASDLAFLFAAAVFTTEALPVRRGGAARHGARLPLLLLPATVFGAMLESLCCRGGASINFAPPIRTVLSAAATGMSKSLAALNVAHFRVAAAMSDTQFS